MAMAALAVPLVVSLHSVVGLDFAASLMPGWEETIFPPYFVVGAMYSGFAMVVVPRRHGALGLRHAGDHHRRPFRRHGEGHAGGFDHHGGVLRDRMVRRLVQRRAQAARCWSFMFTGTYCAAVWALLACNVRDAAGVLVPRRAAQRCRGLRHRRHHQHRHVARAHPDHLEHAVARLPAEHVAQLHADDLGLDAAIRLARIFRSHVPDLLPRGAGGVDARDAQTGARRQGGEAS